MLVGDAAARNAAEEPPRSRHHKLDRWEILAWVVVASLLVARLFPLVTLPPLGDEPDDMGILLNDVRIFGNYFTGAIATDQSRLPFVLATPLVQQFQENVAVPIRLMFFLANIGSVAVWFRTIRITTGSRGAAWLFTVLTMCSCYMASFSIFGLTTSDSLYLLFQALCVLQFVKTCCLPEAGAPRKAFFVFTLLVALCVASKLFGILFMVAAFLTDLSHRRYRVAVPAPRLPWLFAASIAQFVLLLVLQGAPSWAPAARWAGAAALGLWYLFFLTWLVAERRGKFLARETHIVTYWAALTLAAVHLVLLFSPVYLNLKNVLSIFNWFSDWNADPAFVQHSNLYDMPLIFTIKYGVISSGVLAAIVTAWVVAPKTRPLIDAPAARAWRFLALLFLVHAFAITVTRHKVTWYPLGVFPLLYAPVVLFVHDAWTRGSSWMKRAALAAVIVIGGDNLARYAYWYPYGHVDGAQFGREHIGWNRSGFITFEVIPDIIEYFKREPGHSGIRLGVCVVDVQRYNNWAAALLGQELRQAQVDVPPGQGRCDDTAAFSALLTSPLFDAASDTRVAAYGDYGLAHVFSIKTIPIVNLWYRRR